MIVKFLASIFGVIMSCFLFGQKVVTIHNEPTQKFTDALLIGPDNYLYAADYAGSSVYKMSPYGSVSEFITGLNTPNGIAFNSLGEFYICDNLGNAIYKTDAQGNFIDTFSVPSPSGLIKDFDSDTLLFTTYAGHSVKKLSPEGDIIDYFSGGKLDGPVGLCFNPNGELYIGNFDDRKIFKVDDDTLQFVATIPGFSNTYLGFIAWAQGGIWATSFNGHTIYKVNPNYVDSVVKICGNGQGSVDGPVDTARFFQPNGIIASITGDTVFVGQYGNGHLRAIVDISTSTTPISGNFKPTIFPNPANQQVHISGPINLIHGIEIFNLNGSLIGSYYEPVIDVSGFDQGMYIIKCKDQPIIQKLLITH